MQFKKEVRLTIPYVFEDDIEHGVCKRLTPLIRRVICNNPGPFTYTGTTTFIVGNGVVAIIDPGPNNISHLDAIIAALDPSEVVSHILVTHTHSDHSPLANSLKERTGAKICGFVELNSDTPRAKSRIDTKVAIEDANFVEMEEAIQRDFNPDIPLQHQNIVNGPDWTLEAIHTPGHIHNHLCFLLHEEKTMFTGDHIMGWATSVIVPPDGNMADYMDSLERLLSFNLDLLRPTHGPAIESPKTFINAYITHRQNREEQILGQLAKGTTQIQDMIPVLYADIDKRLYPAAAMSVLAHIEGLVRSGKVVCNNEIKLSSDFQLK